MKVWHKPGIKRMTVKGEDKKEVVPLCYSAGYYEESPGGVIIKGQDWFEKVLKEKPEQVCKYCKELHNETK